MPTDCLVGPVFGRYRPTPPTLLSIFCCASFFGGSLVELNVLQLEVLMMQSLLDWRSIVNQLFLLLISTYLGNDKIAMIATHPWNNWIEDESSGERKIDKSSHQGRNGRSHDCCREISCSTQLTLSSPRSLSFLQLNSSVSPSPSWVLQSQVRIENFIRRSWLMIS